MPQHRISPTHQLRFARRLSPQGHAVEHVHAAPLFRQARLHRSLCTWESSLQSRPENRKLAKLVFPQLAAEFPSQQPLEVAVRLGLTESATNPAVIFVHQGDDVWHRGI